MSDNYRQLAERVRLLRTGIQRHDVLALADAIDALLAERDANIRSIKHIAGDVTDICAQRDAITAELDSTRERVAKLRAVFIAIDNLEHPKTVDDAFNFYEEVSAVVFQVLRQNP